MRSGHGGRRAYGAEADRDESTRTGGSWLVVDGAGPCPQIEQAEQVKGLLLAFLC